MPPDISVIITSRDRLWALPQAVASCRSVTLRMQIIVVDDGSNDGTKEWLSTQHDILQIAGDGWGQGWALNRAMALAEGTHIRFLDSDDWLNAGSNEGQFAVAEKEQADIVVAGSDRYHGETLIERKGWVASDDLIAQQLGESDGSHYSAFLLRREFIKNMPHRTLFPAADFAVRLDRCYVLELALRHPRVAIYGSPTLCHRMHDNPRLQFRHGLRGVGTNIQHLFIYRQILSLLEHRGELTLRRKRAAINVLWPLAHWIARTHLADAREVVEWIHRLDPDFRPPESGMLGALYRHLGFAVTERLLSARRRLRGQRRSFAGADLPVDDFRLAEIPEKP
jgi:glycosyltransferase involved in cell wall biosynthesis